MFYPATTVRQRVSEVLQIQGVALMFTASVAELR